MVENFVFNSTRVKEKEWDYAHQMNQVFTEI